jgi:hypothetical protein
VGYKLRASLCTKTKKFCEIDKWNVSRLTIRATPTEESSLLCNLYLTILRRKENPTIIVSGFLK